MPNPPVLPPVGEFSYAGVNFPTETKSEVSARMKYDDSGRSVEHVIHTISVECVLTAACLINLVEPGVSGQATDGVMDEIVQRLSFPGAILVYEGKGYMSLSCNDPEFDVFDVDFGPKPKMISWQPIGNTAAKVSWQVEVALPVCPEGDISYQSVLLSLNFTQDFSIDHLGHNSKTTTGVITIPMTRSQNGDDISVDTTLPDSADEYWSDVFDRFDIPWWCRRTTNQRYLSYDKRSLRFRLVDTQMGQNMLPPNVSDMQASQSVSPMKDPNQQTIYGRYILAFNATITMGRFVDRSSCYQVFIDWFRDRLNSASRAGFAFIPIHLSLEEPDVFGNGPTGKFSVAFIMRESLTKSNASTWLTGTALWKDSPYDYDIWLSTMRFNEVNTALGSAGLAATRNDDELVTNCEQPQGSYGGTFTYLNMPFGGEMISFPVVKPSADSSWLSYKNQKIIEANPGTIKHKLLPDDMIRVDTQLTNNFDNDDEWASVSDLTGIVTNADDTDVVQSVKSPTVRIYLAGEATRFALAIPMPVLATFDGEPISPTGNPIFISEQTGNFGYPVNWASWYIAYDIPYSDAASSYVINAPNSPLSGMDINRSSANPVPNNTLQGDGVDNDEEEFTDFYDYQGEGE